MHERSRLCLDVGEKKRGGKVVFKECNGSAEQRWKWDKLYF